MSFKKNFFKNISTFAFYNYTTQGLEFLSTIILARLLLPKEYGLVAIIAIFSGFIQLFSTLGIGTSVVRTNYGYTFHRHLYNLSIWLGVLLTLILILLAWPISFFFSNEELILPTVVISFKFLFDSLSYVPYALLSKQLKFNILGSSRLARDAFQIGLTIILAFAGFSYWSLIIPLTIGPLIQYLILYRKVNVRLRVFGWRATLRIAYKIRSLMGNLTLNNFIKYWAGNADRVVIGKLYTETDLGLYNRALRFISMTNNLITGIFGAVLFPSLKNLMDEKGDANKEYLDILRIITLLNMFLVIILVLFPETLVFYLWGADWMGVSPFLPYVGIILIYDSIRGTLGSLYLLYERERYLLFTNAINSLLMVALVIIGGMLSMMHIIRFLALGYILITVPINMYFGFYRSFGYTIKGIFRFWLPYIAFGLSLFFAVEFEFMVLRWVLILIFMAFLLFEIRTTLGEVLNQIKKRYSQKI